MDSCWLEGGDDFVSCPSEFFEDLGLFGSLRCKRMISSARKKFTESQSEDGTSGYEVSTKK